MNIFDRFRKRPIVFDYEGRQVLPSDVQRALLMSARDGHDYEGLTWECAPEVAWSMTNDNYLRVTIVESAEKPGLEMQKKLYSDTLAGRPLDVSWTAEPGTLKLLNNKGTVILVAKNIGVPTI